MQSEVKSGEAGSLFEKGGYGRGQTGSSPQTALQRERTGQEEMRDGCSRGGRLPSGSMFVLGGGGGAGGDIRSIACDFGEGLFRGEMGVG